jgi:small-conductance mechanosensitive channel
MDLNRIYALMGTTVGGNTIGEYLQALAMLCVLYLVFILIQRLLVKHLGRLADRTATDADNLMVSLLSKVGRFTFFVLALYLAASSLNLSPFVHNAIRTLVVIVVTIRVALFIQEALKFGLRHVYQKGRDKKDPAVESAVSSLSGILRWLIWLAALLFMLDNLGINITTMVAGIGITGIAVAMASQAILGDAFSAFAIFLDKPFEVGDFIIVDNYLGSVEHIGLKTTRIRSLYGEQLIIANSDLTRSRIKNYKRMQMRRATFNFNLSYETPVDKLRKVPDLVKEVIKSAQVRMDHVHLMNFGTSAFVFEAVFYLDTPDMMVFMDKQQEINLAILEVLEKEGLKLAPPAQNIYVKEQESSSKGQVPKLA